MTAWRVLQTSTENYSRPHSFDCTFSRLHSHGIGRMIPTSAQRAFGLGAPFLLEDQYLGTWPERRGGSMPETIFDNKQLANSNWPMLKDAQSEAIRGQKAENREFDRSVTVRWLVLFPFVFNKASR